MTGWPAAGRSAAAGGTVLAQDEASSVVWGMPGRGGPRGPRQALLPPEGLADQMLAAGAARPGRGVA